MECAVERDDLVSAALEPAAPLPSELDGALVGLGAGVREEHATAAAEQRIDARGQLRLPVVVVEVRDVQQRARLLGERVGTIISTPSESGGSE